jgi:hypothetical protein
MQSSNDLTRLAYSLSQKRLGAQVSIATSADLRAMLFAVLFLLVAVCCVILSPGVVPVALAWPGVALLISAAALAAYTARPVDFHAPGANYADLQEDIAGDAALSDVYAELGAFADKHIKNNDIRLARNARLFGVSIVLALVGAALCIAAHTL